MANTAMLYDRAYPLDGIRILSRADGDYGDGRTVEAYAAVFNRKTEVKDVYGHYVEEINRSAFNRTLSHNGTSKTLVLYNHGNYLGTNKPDSMAQIPIGKPLDIKPDNNGLMTITRYNKSEYADRILESIKNDEITGQSFQGQIYRSDPNRVPSARPGQPLPIIRRLELGLSNYGPTPSPVYTDPMIVAIRSAQDLYQDYANLTEDERAELSRMINATANPATGTEDSRDAHSNRMKLLRLKAELAFLGVQ